MNEVDRARAIAHQAWGHLDCLLLYSTGYPTDSHVTNARKFMEHLAQEAGITRRPRTESAYPALTDSNCMPPYPAKPITETPETQAPNQGVQALADRSAAAVRAACDWPAGEFTFADDPGEHDPCYVVMPGGAALPLNHHAGDGVDVARAKFIVSACNAALASGFGQPNRDKLIDLIRTQLMSTDYPVSQWEQDFADVILALALTSHAGEVRAALDPFRRVWAISFAPFDNGEGKGVASHSEDSGIGPRLPTAWPTIADLRRLAALAQPEAALSPAEDGAIDASGREGNG